MSLKERPDFSEFQPISFEEWKEKAQKDLKGKPLEELTWEAEGFAVSPFHTREQAHGTDLSGPGSSPYRRGVLLNENEWRIRVPFRPDEGASIAKALEQGVQCISLGTSSGTDARIPDEGLGAERLELCSEKDPEEWKSILREKWKEVPANGAFLFDPVSSLLKEGAWPCDGKEGTLEELVGVSNELYRNGSTWHSIPVKSAPFHNAGATLVEELAFTISQAHDLLVTFLENGWSIDELTPRFHNEMSAGPLFLPEIAKFRVFRQLWARVVEAYSPEHTCSKAPWLAASTSWWSLTRRDPYTNMVRKTTESMAAVLGGCQELSIHSYDAAGDQHSELGQRVARNTHHLLKEEAQLNKVIDPLGGSYYLEVLTDRIGEAAWDLIREIEEQGGFFAALEKGSVQARIEASRKQRQGSLEHEERMIIGVNAFRDEEASILPQGKDELKGISQGKDVDPLPVERGSEPGS